MKHTNTQTLKSFELLMNLLVKFGKGRRLAFRRDGESPRKIYKPLTIDNIRMFPSDPTGSLDDFFLRGYLNYWGFF